MRRKARIAKRLALSRQHKAAFEIRNYNSVDPELEDYDEQGRTVEAAFLIWKHFPVFTSYKDILSKPWYEFLSMYDEARYREQLENWKLQLSVSIPRLF